VLLGNPEIAKYVLNSTYGKDWHELTDSLTESTADECWKSACKDVIKKGNYAKV